MIMGMGTRNGDGVSGLILGSCRYVSGFVFLCRFVYLLSIKYDHSTWGVGGVGNLFEPVRRLDSVQTLYIYRERYITISFTTHILYAINKKQRRIPNAMRDNS